MPRGSGFIDVAGSALSAMNAELFVTRERQLLTVAHATAGGSSHIDSSFGFEVRFRLVYVRCHFAGGAGNGPMTITLDSIVGADYDARLYTITKAGLSYDVNFRIPATESEDPSPWTFQPGDRVRVQWTNPGGITWGLEVGLALAS